MTRSKLAALIPQEAAEAGEIEITRMAKLGINPAQIARAAITKGEREG